MQIKIAARHGHLNEEHQKEIQAKVEKLLHYFGRISMIEVMIDLHESSSIAVEIKVDAEHKHDFVAREKDNEMKVALDAAIEKIKQQIHRYKDKIQDHRRDPSHNSNGE